MSSVQIEAHISQQRETEDDKLASILFLIMSLIESNIPRREREVAMREVNRLASESDEQFLRARHGIIANVRKLAAVAQPLDLSLVPQIKDDELRNALLSLRA